MFRKRVEAIIFRERERGHYLSTTLSLHLKHGPLVKCFMYIRPGIKLTCLQCVEVMIWIKPPEHKMSASMLYFFFMLLML